MKGIFVAAIASSLFGCDRPSSPTAATAPAATAPAASMPETNRRQFGGADFVVPSQWTAAEAMGGLLLTAPEMENDWQANAFLELRRDAKGRSLEQALDDLAPNLKSRKAQFQEVARGVRSHSSGFRYAILEYTCSAQGTPLTEQEIVIELEGNKRLFLMTSTASGSQPKYRPVFQSLLESFRVGQP